MVETEIGTFQSTASVNYRGKMFADSFEILPLKTRTLVNLTERWEAKDGGLSASIWIKNLLNQYYDDYLSLLSPVGTIGQPGAPRTFGVTIGYKFGS